MKTMLIVIGVVVVIVGTFLWMFAGIPDDDGWDGRDE